MESGCYEVTANLLTDQRVRRGVYAASTLVAKAFLRSRGAVRVSRPEHPFREA